MATGYAPMPRLRVDRDELVRAIDLRTIIQLDSQRDHGDYISGRCPHPAHEDRSPSFLVYPERYVCLTTGAHGPEGFTGTVIDWYCFAETHPAGISFQALLRLIADFYSVGQATADFNTPRAIPKIWVESLPETTMSPDKFSVLKGAALTYFSWRYQLPVEVIQHERIGYVQRLKAFAIPIWDADHREILAVRYRRHDAAFAGGEFMIGSWEVPRYFGVKGHNPVLLYNRHRLKYPRSDTLRICFGEMTALFYDQVLGLDAITVTNGAKAFKRYFVNLVKRVYDKIIICPDGGELIQAVKVGMQFNYAAQIVVPLMDAGDLIDWVRDSVLASGAYLDYEQANLVPYDGIKRTGAQGTGLWT
jgi:hypothetical protein